MMLEGREGQSLVILEGREVNQRAGGEDVLEVLLEESVECLACCVLHAMRPCSEARRVEQIALPSNILQGIARPG